MKFLKLFVGLLLLVTLFSTLAFAGKSAGVAKGSTGQVTSLSPWSTDRAARLKVLRQEDDQATPALLKGSRMRPEASAIEPTVDVNAVASAPIPAGTYDVPGAYLTLKDALTDINTNGLAGNVVLRLVSASYFENPMTLGGAYPGAGTFSVTIQPKAGVAATVKFISYASNGKGISLSGANNVTIDGLNASGASLTLDWDLGSSTFPTGDGNAANIYITAGSSNITLQHLTIKGLSNATAWDDVTDARYCVHINGSPTANTNITVAHNVITGGFYGILARTLSAGVLNGPLTITDNNIGGAYGRQCAMGIFTQNSNNLTIARNNVKGLQMNEDLFNLGTWIQPFNVGQLFAILAQSINTASTVNSNVVDDYVDKTYEAFGFVVYGIRAVGRATNNPLIYNNSISRIRTDGDSAATIFEMRMQTGTYYNNSISLSGSSSDGTSAPGPLYQTGSFKNNIVSHTMDVGPNGLSTPSGGGSGSDYNVLYQASPGKSFDLSSLIAATSSEVHSVQGNPYFKSASDLHIDTTQLSAASNMGWDTTGIATDVDGQARQHPPDAGWDEFTLGTDLNHDMYAYSITAPDPLGTLVNIPVAPVVVVRNNRPAAEASVTVRFKVDSLGTNVYNQTVTVAFASLEKKSLTFPSWKPFTSAASVYTLTAIAELGTDQILTNDTTSRGEVVSPVHSGTSYTSGFETPTDIADWTTTGDWAIGSTAKFGGAHSGTKVAVTKVSGNYTDQSCGNLTNLYTPYFDFTSNATPSLSWYQAIQVEPVWDGMTFEYSIDTGRTYHLLGIANDPNGINWLKTGVYLNANNNDTVCWGQTIGNAINCGGGVTNFQITPKWTSNGDCEGVDVHTGPNGYVFVEYHDLGAIFGGKNFVRFRFRFYSDGGGNDIGWAVDDFKIDVAAPIFAGGTIKGTRYLDVNGNGVDNAEPADTGKVYLDYFGVSSDSQSTSGVGAYSFPIGLPGTYQVRIKKPGFAITQPAAPGYDGQVVVNHPAAGDSTGKDIGTYLGTVSGLKYNDKNTNGVKDGGEAGLAGFTIQLRKDSCTGGVIESAVTGAPGTYQFVAGPGTFYVSEVKQAAYRETQPLSNCYTVTISGVSGAGTAIVTGQDFGNFKLGLVKIQKVVDINGNGIKDPGDATSMPAGAIGIFELKKGATHVRFDTIGNLVLNKTITLDTGSYTETEIFTTPGWVRTIPPGSPTIPFVIDTGGISLTTFFGNFKMLTVSGTKFDDKNGNHVRDTLEPGLAGWKINIRGGVFYGGTSATTDANGIWTIDSVGGGADTVTEVSQAGWTVTLPVSGSYTFASTSGVDVPGNAFGNFRIVTVSGTKYRDRNASGARDAGEDGLAGWQLNLTGVGGGVATSDANGNFSFPAVGPGSHVLTETPQAGWFETQPVGGNYTFSPTSGVNVTGRDFGNFRSTDSSIFYRTLSVADLIAGSQVKPVKRPKPGKPIVMPNVANVLAELYLQNGNNPGVVVGVPTAVNAAGKPKAHLLPGKYTDVQATLWKKGISHNPALARGYDFDNKSKQMLKRFKSLPASKQDNGLTAELLALSVNIALSDLAKAESPGLGELIFNDGNPAHAALNGLTVRKVKAAGDTALTNFEFQPLSVYQNLEAVAREINCAFSNGLAGCDTVLPIDTVSWVNGAKIKLKGVRNVLGISYLKANPNAEPWIVPSVPPAPVPVPDVYTLYQNYPNPFNPTTIIEFDLPSDAFVTLKVYNILGQQIATLYDHELLDAGNQDVEFDATALPSGIYFYRLVAQSLNDDGVSTGQTFKTVKKMMMVK